MNTLIDGMMLGSAGFQLPSSSEKGMERRVDVPDGNLALAGDVCVGKKAIALASLHHLTRS